MALDRYSRPYLLPEHLHCCGLPFEIEAGALLVDTKTDNVLVQLKMASHADANVKAVKVTVQPADVKGDSLGDPVTHQYLDLDVRRGESFGQRTPIPLPDNSARSFSIMSVEVVYEGNEVAASNGEWAPLPEQEALRASISDEELIKQYQIDFGKGCVYRLQEMGDLWRCVCGTTNREDEEACHCCGQQLSVLRAIDPRIVEERKSERLEAERIEYERQLERERIAAIEAEKAAEESKRRHKKTAVIIAAIAAALAVAYFGITTIVIPLSKYNDAVALMETGDLAGAEAAFKALGDYKDSQTRVKECQYNKAVALLEEGKYSSAKKAFESLGDFQDSSTKAAECEDGIAQEVDAVVHEMAESLAAGDYEAAKRVPALKQVDTPDEVFALAERKAMANANVGDIVIYGNNGDSGPVKWRVLNKDEDGALILSLYGWTSTAVNDDKRDDDWSMTGLRKNMQDSGVINGIFSIYETAGIDEREHVYDGEYDETLKGYREGTEKKTNDKLFLLSRVDVERYLPDPADRLATSEEGETITWWLSDTDGSKKWPYESGQNYTTMFCCVSRDGSIFSVREGFDTNWARPAMWVSFD